eukprot:gene1450-1663_t
MAQKHDISKVLGYSDMYDFLIDIVPRDSSSTIPVHYTLLPAPSSPPAPPRAITSTLLPCDLTHSEDTHLPPQKRPRQSQPLDSVSSVSWTQTEALLRNIKANSSCTDATFDLNCDYANPYLYTENHSSSMTQDMAALPHPLHLTSSTFEDFNSSGRPDRMNTPAEAASELPRPSPHIDLGGSRAVEGKALPGGMA